MFKQIINNTEKYGSNVSTLDWLKFLAVITMTIDHIGWCFIAESNQYYTWFRTFGRIHVPIWFFFAGYSLKDKAVKNNIVDKQLILCATILLFANLISYRSIAPLNVLFSIIICRESILWLKNKEMIPNKNFDIFIICAVFSLLSQPLFEYGTLGILYAIMGYMVKNGNNKQFKHKMFFFATFLCFMVYQYIGTSPNLIQTIVMTLGVGYYSWRLANFKMYSFPWFEKHYKINYIVRLLGRNTLYYYTIHRSIFVLFSYYGGFHNVENFAWLGLFGL